MDSYKEYSNSSKKIEVSNTCFETYPCQHYVKLDGKPETKLMRGNQIKHLFISNNIPVPEHFRDY